MDCLNERQFKRKLQEETMSEYAALEIEGYPAFHFRNILDKEICGFFFSDKDLKITHNFKYNPDDFDETPINRYVYTTTVSKARDRLDAMGYSISQLEKLFTSKDSLCVDYDSFIDSKRINYDEDNYYEFIRDRFLKNVTLKKWINSTKKIVEYETIHGEIDERSVDKEIKLTTECDKIIYYSKKKNRDGFYNGLNTSIIDKGLPFRILLECFNPDDTITLDFTNLQFWDDITKSLGIDDEIEKTIVLVEGSSDRTILEFGMKQLFSHVDDIFYFMDFEFAGTKREGSASALSNNVKTFVASKLRARIIAIYDNDTAGQFARLKLLEGMTLPDNVRVLNYPNLNCFDSYPTYSPNKAIVFDNINGRACSIEMYLPDECISNESGFYSIEWENLQSIKLSSGVNKEYQGVISNKDTIKNNVFTLMKKIDSGEMSFKPERWMKLNELLRVIVFAFR